MRSLLIAAVLVAILVAGAVALPDPSLAPAAPRPCPSRLNAHVYHH